LKNIIAINLPLEILCTLMGLAKELEAHLLL